MSERRKPDIRLTLSGDWWYFAGAIGALYRSGDVIATPRLSGQEVTFTISERQSGAPVDMGEISITGDKGDTHVTVTLARPEARPFWEGDDETSAGGIVPLLYEMAIRARSYRQQAHGLVGEEVIEFYYRSRAAGSKITLRRLAEIYGFSTKYLSNAKAKYDRAGGWGSKAHKAGGQKS